MLITKEALLRKKLLAVAVNEIGVKEQTGNNDGERVEAYLHYVGLKKGHAWCAAFVSWVHGQAGLKLPKSAWSPNLLPVVKRTKNILEGQVLGIWFPNLKRIAHVGIVEKKQGDWIIAIEGNTNSLGSREGDGVYRKRRHVHTIYAYADWIKEELP